MVPGDAECKKLAGDPSGPLCNETSPKCGVVNPLPREILVFRPCIIGRCLGSAEIVLEIV
jgi:hypothetical protein